MTHTQGTQVFETIANALDKHYLLLNNAGYDLAELEAIDINNWTVSLIFDPSYSDPLVVEFEVVEDPLMDVVGAIVDHVTDL